jgi:hypothetical protein
MGKKVMVMGIQEGLAMTTIKYRKSVALGRFIILLGFVLGSVFLILSTIFDEAPFYRKLYWFTAAIAALWYFGRISLLMIIKMPKNRILFSFDSDYFYVKQETISTSRIQKIDFISNVPTGFLGVKCPGYVIECFDNEKVMVPMYFVLSKKEQPVITKKLKQYTSQRKAR